MARWNVLPNGWYSHPTDPRRLRRFPTTGVPSPTNPTTAFELYDVDGTVTRLELNGTVGPTTLPRFVAVWKRDAYDNQTTYTWITVNGPQLPAHGQLRPETITYASGVRERHTYTDPNGKTYHDVVVTYENFNGPTGGVTAADLTWGYRMENDGRMLHLWKNKRKVVVGPGGPGTVPATSATGGPLYPLSEQDLYYIVQYKWLTTADGDKLVEEVREYHLTTTTPPAATAGQGTRIMALEYSKATISDNPSGYSAVKDLYRVSKQTDRWGNEHSFHYEIAARTFPANDPNPGFDFYDYYVTRVQHVAPNGTTTTLFRDEKGRITKSIVAPADNATGLPRKYETRDNPKIPEPTTITTILEYDAAVTCLCGKPKRVTELPSGRITDYVWSSSTGLLLSSTTPDPAAPLTGAGSDARVTYTYQYENGWDQSPPRFSLLKKITQPDGSTIEFQNNFAASTTRLDPTHGNKLLSITSKSELISASSGSFRIEEASHFDGNGRLVQHVDPEGTDTRFFYNSLLGYGAFFLRTRTVGYQQTGETTTQFTFDDLGRLLERIDDLGSVAESKKTFTLNPRGLATKVTVQRAGFLEEQLLHYDVWDNLVVALTKNFDSSGGQQTGPSGTSTGRTWIRREWQWEKHRLHATYVDRRPLHEADNPGDPLGGTNPWMLQTLYAHDGMGDLTSVVRSNGSSVTIVRDGYRETYIVKVEDPAKTIENEQARYYVDGALRVIARKRIVGDGSPLYPSTTLQYDAKRNLAGAIVEAYVPEVAKPQGYNRDIGGQKTWFQRRYDGSLTGIHTYSKAGILVGSRDIVLDEAGRTKEVKDRILGSPNAGDPTHRITTYELNKRSQPTLITATSTGRKIAYVYDTKGRLDTVDDGQATAATATKLTYLAGTDLVATRETTLQRGVLSGSASTKKYKKEYLYGLAGVLTKVKDHGEVGGGTTGDRETTLYTNSFGLVDKTVDPAGHVLDAYYDGLFRRVSAVRRGTTPARDLFATTIYEDAPVAGGETAVQRIDPKGFVTKSTYDYLGRAVVVQRPGASLTSPPTPTAKHKAHSLFYEYDAGNRRIHAYDGRGIQIDFHHDALDRLLVRESPNVASLVNQVSQLTVRDVLERDDLGRVVANGTFLGALGANMVLNNAQTREIDSLGRMHKESYLYLGGQATAIDILRAYTNVDYRTKLTYSSGANPLETTFGFDSALGRLNDIDMKLPGAGSSSNNLADYAHMGSSVNQRRLHYGGTANGLTSFDFDHYGRGSQVKDEIGAAVLAQIDFEYDVLDNLIKETYRRPSTPSGWTTGGDRFFYDEFNRLTQAWLGLDAAGMSAATSSLPSQNFKDRTLHTLDDGGNRSNLDFLSSATSYTRAYSLEDDGPGSSYDRALWVEGWSNDEPLGHLSLNVGNPDGGYASYGFAAPGIVYPDVSPGGEIDPDRFLWISGPTADHVRSVLDSLLGRWGIYFIHRTCRWWAKKQFSVFKKTLIANGLACKGTPPRRRTPKNYGWKLLKCGLTTTTTTVSPAAARAAAAAVAAATSSDAQK